MFLEIGGCKAYAMEKGEEPERPFVMSDAMGLVWVGEYVQVNENIGKVLVLMGPMYHSEVSLQTIEERMREKGISLSLRGIGRQILMQVPVLSVPARNQYIRMLHFAATNRLIQADEFLY